MGFSHFPKNKMHTYSYPQTIYLIRHATPDWERTDIPYDIPPGPALTQHGEREAQQLGHFLKNAGIKKLYHSPLERCARTAQIASTIAGVPVLENNALAEWRKGETEAEMHNRFWPVLEA